MKRVLLLTGLALFACIALAVGLVKSGMLGPRITRTIWQYDRFEFVGDSEEADLLLVGAERPANLVIEGREGQTFPMSSLDWQTATSHATSTDHEIDQESGGLEVEMVRTPENHFRHFSATFKSKQFVSARAGEVKVINAGNGQQVRMPATWADIERCFGKPLKKSRLSHSAPWRYSSLNLIPYLPMLLRPADAVHGVEPR